MWWLYPVTGVALFWVMRCAIRTIADRDSMLDGCWLHCNTYAIEEHKKVNFKKHLSRLLLGRNPASLYGPLMQLSLSGPMPKLNYAWWNMYTEKYLKLTPPDQHQIDLRIANNGWSLLEAIFIYTKMTPQEFQRLTGGVHVSMEPVPVMAGAAEEYDQIIMAQELIQWPH